MKILIIEDDERIAVPMKEDFERQNNQVKLAFDGQEGYRLGSSNEFDVIILDIMLPMMDGMLVCQKLRKAGCTAAIIMLTARTTTTNKIMGLDCGADDYMAKPFELDELSARIRAVLRRGADGRQPVLKAGALEVDQNTCVVRFGYKELDLTPTEYKLLTHFLNNPNRTYSKHDLLDRIWHHDSANNAEVIKTHIKGLRKKMQGVGAPSNIIQTVYGLGYRFTPHA